MTEATQQERMRLWSAAYMARLKQGNAVRHIDYQSHYPAVERADHALKAFDERFTATQQGKPS